MSRIFEIELDVAEDDIEPIYNHVHHAQSLCYLEMGRLRLLLQLGIPNETLIAQGLYLVITSLAVRYKREVQKGAIRVTCEDPRVEGRVIVIDQKLYNHRGKLAVEARIEIMCLLRETSRAVDPPAFLCDALSAV